MTSTDIFHVGNGAGFSGDRKDAPGPVEGDDVRGSIDLAALDVHEADTSIAGISPGALLAVNAYLGTASGGDAGRALAGVRQPGQGRRVL